MTQSTLIDRYQNNDCEAVWNEIVQLGPAVQHEPLRSDVLAVIHETIDRAIGNLKLIHQRLVAMGYEFADPGNALRFCSTPPTAAIEEIERQLGSLPMLIRHWFERIERVDFRQSERQWRSGQSKPPEAPDIYGLGGWDVIFHSPVEAMEEMRQAKKDYEDDYQHLFNLLKTENPDLDDAMIHAEIQWQDYLPIGGCATNNEPKGFAMPSDAADGVFYDDGHAVYFHEELRDIFYWGGFPRWSILVNHPNEYRVFEYRPKFAKLYPMLADGLRPV